MNDSAVQKNLLAIQEYSKQTRAIVRELEEKTKQVDVLRLELDMIKSQIQTLFQRV